MRIDLDGAGEEELIRYLKTFSGGRGFEASPNRRFFIRLRGYGDFRGKIGIEEDLSCFVNNGLRERLVIAAHMVTARHADRFGQG